MTCTSNCQRENLNENFTNTAPLIDYSSSNDVVFQDALKCVFLGRVGIHPRIARIQMISLKNDTMLAESIVVGVYGIQGVGKTYLLKMIAQERIEWSYVDGSELIRDALRKKDMNMDDFRMMSSLEKAVVRKKAIESVKKKSGLTLIAGHCSFPSDEVDIDGSVQFNDVFTHADGATYDLIIYLEKPIDHVLDQIKNDKHRVRGTYTKDTLQRWVEHEKMVLKTNCREHGIEYREFNFGEAGDHQKLISLIVDEVIVPACKRANQLSELNLVDSVKRTIPAADVYLLIDGDGTLCAQDSGKNSLSLFDYQTLVILLVTWS